MINPAVHVRDPIMDKPQRREHPLTSFSTRKPSALIGNAPCRERKSSRRDTCRRVAASAIRGSPIAREPAHRIDLLIKKPEGGQLNFFDKLRYIDTERII